ncbi:DUF397 domain-containing protein [Embleya sp. AB8]|uniref:DUF397 domain-containing protein n=1 Tax=Embleya sp. AB8 TaxID=3156304 RepID=UPI003C74AD9C
MIENVHPRSASVPTRAIWRTSSYSNGGGECVQVAHVTHATQTGVRDSKLTNGPIQSFGAAAWTALLSELKRD